MEKRLKVLFVDDDLNVLNGLKRMLRTMRDKWQMNFVENGEQALQVLSQEIYDVIISDMRIPGMNGAKLLLEIQKKYPSMIRIILSGQTDKEMILKSVKPAHQYLSKPCDADTIVNTVKRANSLRELLQDEKITSVVSNIDTLPSLPTLYLEIMSEINSKNSSLHKVGEIISKDVGMTAKILQLINSSFFGLPRHITNPSQAVSLLGIEILKALVLSVHIFSQYNEKEVSGFSMEQFRTHSLNTAFMAKSIAKEESLSKMLVDEVFMAGILHDVGKIVLALGLPELYSESIKLAQSHSLSAWQSEQEIFGTSHSEIGAYLLGLWGFSDMIVESIAFHHCPSKFPDEEFITIAVIYFANQCEHNINGTLNNEKINLAHLEEDKLENWLSICKKIKQNGKYK